MKNLYLFVSALFIFCSISNINAQDKSKMPKTKLPKGFVLIEGGTYQITPEASIPMRSFYMSATEVSNKEYRTFLADLKANGKEKEYEIAKVQQAPSDSLNKYTIFKTYADEPAYDDYPVVNISREGMDLYCAWLNSQIKQDPKSEYQLLLRLPSAIEWEYAATGGVAKKKLPWEGNKLTTDRGIALANFGSVEGPNQTFTSPVKSYEPTKNGLYNIMGNVAEMTNDPAKIVKGGSWHATEADMKIQNNDYMRYRSYPSPAIGFRPVIGIYPKSLMEN